MHYVKILLKLMILSLLHPMPQEIFNEVFYLL